MGEIKMLIVHCSDSPDTRDIGFIEINQWHKERFAGWKDPNGNIIYCGYNYIVRRNGIIEVGRPEGVEGAHCLSHNHDSVSVCWVGSKYMTIEQKHALKVLCLSILKKYGLTTDKIYGHCEFNKHKTCPNFNSVTTFMNMRFFRNFLEGK
jgi:hypothetical protein